MIILDTNVISALMNPEGSRLLEPWLDTVARYDLYTTSITRAEIRYGIARLPSGLRRTRIENSADALFADVEDRLLSFDSIAADRYGELVALRERDGHPISIPDAQIAAIAYVNRAAVATRDRAGFADSGVRVVDPFSFRRRASR